MFSHAECRYSRVNCRILYLKLPSIGVSILDAILDIQAKSKPSPLYLRMRAQAVYVLILTRRRRTAGLDHFLHAIVSRPFLHRVAQLDIPGSFERGPWR
jgi:hypothetical protein